MSSKAIHVPLTAAELSACRQAATFRWQMARASGVSNQRRDGGRSDDDIDFLGIRAETAAAKLYGLDYSPHHLGVDSGADMFAGDLAIDVKSTFHAGGRLLLKGRDWATADLYILVTATGYQNLMSVVGGVTREKLLENGVMEDLGHGEGLTLTPDKLASPQAIWRFLCADRFKDFEPGEPEKAEAVL